MAVTELEKARAVLGLTQEELAEKAGVDRRTIGRAEAGRRPGFYITRFKIAEAVGSTPEALWPDGEEVAS